MRRIYWMGVILAGLLLGPLASFSVIHSAGCPNPTGIGPRPGIPGTTVFWANPGDPKGSYTFFQKEKALASGTITQIQISLKSAGSVQVGVFSSNGSVGSLLGSSPLVSLPAGLSMVPLSSGVPIPAGTDFWTAVYTPSYPGITWSATSGGPIAMVNPSQGLAPAPFKGMFNGHLDLWAYLCP